MKIGIILNFNNFKSTILCIENLLDSGIDRLVVVDNASSNNSFKILKDKYSDDYRISIIKSDMNRGYASGNNIGLRVAEKKYGTKNIIYIVNPDVQVNSKIIKNISLFIKQHPQAGMVTGKVNNTLQSCWHHTGLIRCFVFNALVLKWFLFKLNINENKKYNKFEERFKMVDVVSGAFFGISQEVFKKINYFDEGTFLFYEEEILFCKLKRYGFQNYLMNNVGYQHKKHGSSSFTKLKFKKINDESRSYYAKKYCNAGILYIILYRLINIVDDMLLILFNRAGNTIG